MGIVTNFFGFIQLRITSGDISCVLREITNSNVIIYDVSIQSELSAVVSISGEDYRKVSRIIKKTGGRCELLKQQGLRWMLYEMRKRVIMIAGCLILILLTIFLPTRVFFWEVKGNEKLPANFIIEQVQNNGLRFGCKRSEIRSDKVKNQLLARIPELEWVGITTKGCVAIISVSESQVSDLSDGNTFGNVVAVCDGIVNSVTVTKGNPLCKPGQAVYRGQVLISGYEDCGFVLKHSGAEGDVYASTYRTLNGVSLAQCTRRAEIQRITKHYAVKIGKNIIKFSKDSGISDTSCVKMYSEMFASLPGGFRLPVSLIEETRYTYVSDSYIPQGDDYEWLTDAAKKYLHHLMLGGTILNGDLKILSESDTCWFRGTYSCTEQIGINMIEEIPPYGENS